MYTPPYSNVKKWESVSEHLHLWRLLYIELKYFFTGSSMWDYFWISIVNLPGVTNFVSYGANEGSIQMRWYISYFDPRDLNSILNTLSRALYLNHRWYSSICEKFVPKQQYRLNWLFAWKFLKIMDDYRWWFDWNKHTRIYLNCNYIHP